MIIFESFNKYCHLFFNFFTNFYNPKTLESISFVLPITCSKLACSTGIIVRLKYGSDSVSFDRQPLYSPLLWQARATGKGIIVTLIQISSVFWQQQFLFYILDFGNEPPPQYQPNQGYGQPPQYAPQPYSDHPGFPAGGYTTNTVLVSIQ